MAKRVKKRITFTYTPELVHEPIIYNLSQEFNIVTNIHLADIAEDRGWVVLELEGEEENIEQGLAWAISRGMRVDYAGEDTLR
jgi:L-aspartate semialdehyde sulfurtransferase ferredoxin